jgi:hypothetical protein
MKIFPIVLYLIMWLYSSAVFSQEIIRGYTIKKTSTPIIIDGIIDEISWKGADFTDNYLKMDGSVADVVSKAKILWDDHALYFAIIVQDSSIWSSLTKRDAPLWHQDAVELFIDPDGDGLHYIEMGFSPRGNLYDMEIDMPYSAGGKGNMNWNISGLEYKVNVTGSVNISNGASQWVCEIALPFTGVPPFPKTITLPKVGESWRLNLARVDHNYKNPRESLYIWNYTDGKSYHVPTKFGWLFFSGEVVPGL